MSQRFQHARCLFSSYNFENPKNLEYAYFLGKACRGNKERKCFFSLQ